MIKPLNVDWVVLFGGANRHEAVISMFEYGLSIKAIIVPKDQNKRLSESISKLVGLDAPIFSINKKEVGNALQPFHGCALFSIGFPYLLSAEVIACHELRLNIHPTLLPKYRGPTTGSYVLINGENESGSTVHILEEEMDRGDIVLQSKVAISKFDTVRSLQRKVYATEYDLIGNVLKHLDTEGLTIKQDEKKSSAYPKKRTPEDSEIDPSLSLYGLVDSIRACDPNNYPAFFYIDGQKVCIKLWRPDKASDENDMI